MADNDKAKGAKPPSGGPKGGAAIKEKRVKKTKAAVNTEPRNFERPKGYKARMKAHYKPWCVPR